MDNHDTAAATIATLPDAALPLDAWIERQARISAAKLAGAVSATSLVHRRRHFGQTLRPAKGSVLASPETEMGDAGPDYFFHWLRDAAVVMDAALVLIGEEGASAWIERFEDYVRFSLSVGRISGPRLLASGDDFRAGVAKDFLQFVRPNAEIAAVEGDRALDDVRCNADGTLDFIKWSRPQHDGAAAEALVALRFWDRNRSSNEGARRELAALIRRDLDYSFTRRAEPCFDLWEEESGHHYYTRLVQFAALDRGARWMEKAGDRERARRFDGAAAELRRVLDGFWSADSGIYRSRMPPGGADGPKALDIAVILAVLHTRLDSGPHSVLDPRMRATLARLEALFAADYALNRGQARPFAFGRYKGDRYFSGGAYYFSSFGAAEFHYRLAGAVRAGADGAGASAASLIAEGDAILDGIRRHVPESGTLSEQFDQGNGAQTSAKNLTWSYAAFLTAWDARRAALGAHRPAA